MPNRYSGPTEVLLVDFRNGSRILMVNRWMVLQSRPDQLLDPYPEVLAEAARAISASLRTSPKAMRDVPITAEADATGDLELAALHAIGAAERRASSPLLTRPGDF